MVVKRVCYCYLFSKSDWKFPRVYISHWSIKPLIVKRGSTSNLNFSESTYDIFKMYDSWNYFATENEFKRTFGAYCYFIVNSVKKSPKFTFGRLSSILNVPLNKHSPWNIWQKQAPWINIPKYEMHTSRFFYFKIVFFLIFELLEPFSSIHNGFTTNFYETYIINLNAAFKLNESLTQILNHWLRGLVDRPAFRSSL